MPPNLPTSTALPLKLLLPHHTLRETPAGTYTSKVDLVLRDITPHISMPIVLSAKPLIEMYRKQPWHLVCLQLWQKGYLQTLSLIHPPMNAFFWPHRKQILLFGVLTAVAEKLIVDIYPDCQPCPLLVHSSLTELSMAQWPNTSQYCHSRQSWSL